MLASVLHSDVAIKVSIGIMRAFVEMRRFIANNALLFERISNVELKQIIETSRNNALRKVNEELIHMYWLVGAYLSAESKNAAFGDKYIE